MKRRVKIVVALVAGFAIAGAAAAYSWQSWMNLSESDERVISFFEELDPPVLNRLRITRTPIDPMTETINVGAILTVERPNAVVSIVLQTANDTSGNSMIEPVEWTTRATGMVTTNGGVTTATIPPTAIGVNYDAYRILQERDDGTELYDTVRRPGIIPSPSTE